MNTNVTPLLTVPAPASVPTLSSSAMLVNLAIGSWSASKKDKTASAQLASDNEAKQGLARAYKTLVDSPKLDALRSFITRAHEINRGMTLDWAANLRLCPTKNYFNHTNTMTGLRDEFFKLVDDFIDNDYQWARSEGQVKLGRLYNPYEYPTAEELRRKFYFDIQYMPVPSVGDFRTDLEAEAQDVLRGHYERVYTDAITTAMNGFRERLYTAVQELSKVLTVEEEEYTDPNTGKVKTRARRGKLYDSRITSMRDLISLLDALNITNDPAIQRAHRTLNLAFDNVYTKEDLATTEARLETKKQLDDVLASLPSLDM